MGREGSHGTKELFSLPPLVLKARHLSGSAFCWVDIDLSDQAVGWKMDFLTFHVSIIIHPRIQS